VVYYERTGTVEPMRVSPEAGIPTAAWLIPNVPAGAGHGRYWFRALDGPGGTEGTVGASIVDDERTTGASVGGVPGEPSTVARYVHRDHLGSTRAVTDEAGLPVGTWKYYPFGAEAHATGEPGPRMKFTGHERDAVAGLDYMLARYYGAGLSRFLSTDPASRSAAVRNPQSWNRYTYALNNPVLLVDPDGEAARIFIDNQTTGSTRSSFNETNAAVRVQRTFDKAGADAAVRVGKPGLMDKIGAALKGDTIHVVRVVDKAPATEPAKVQGAIAHTGGGLPTEVHTDKTPSDNAATPQNERSIAVSNAAAHEVGHDLGLSDNQNTSQDVMTTNVTPTSQTTPKDFNQQDAQKLKQATK